MARVKRGVTSHAKHKKVFKAAKGYYGRRKNTIRVAKQAVEKANQYAFRDRKRRKRTFRALWIQRLNAAVRPFGLNYRSSSTGWPRPASWSTARCCPISRSTSRRRSRRSSRRPRPRCRRHLEAVWCAPAAQPQQRNRNTQIAAKPAALLNSLCSQASWPMRRNFPLSSDGPPRRKRPEPRRETTTTSFFSIAGIFSFRTMLTPLTR